MLKNVRLVAGVLALAVLIYAGLWYTAAFQAEKDVTRLLTDWRGAGLQVQHGAIKHGGFPYRITVTIEKLDVRTRHKGLHVSTDSIMLISHLWTPGHWLADAQNLAVEAAGSTTQISAKNLLASYRSHSDGSAVLAFDSTSASAFSIQQLAGVHSPAVDAWSLFLRYGAPAPTQDNGLYGARYLDFKASLAGQVLLSSGDQTRASFTFEGGISGPVITDWAKEQLRAWAFDGGLAEIDYFEYALGEANLTGSASLTLDDDFRPLGSASAAVSGGQILYDSLAITGISGTESLPENGQIGLMIQNGELIADTSILAVLNPLIK